MTAAATAPPAARIVAIPDGDPDLERLGLGQAGAYLIVRIPDELVDDQGEIELTPRLASAYYARGTDTLRRWARAGRIESTTHQAGRQLRRTYPAGRAAEVAPLADDWARRRIDDLQRTVAALEAANGELRSAFTSLAARVESRLSEPEPARLPTAAPAPPPQPPQHQLPEIAGGSTAFSPADHDQDDDDLLTALRPLAGSSSSIQSRSAAEASPQLLAYGIDRARSQLTQLLIKRLQVGNAPELVAAYGVPWVLESLYRAILHQEEIDQGPDYSQWLPSSRRNPRPKRFRWALNHGVRNPAAVLAAHLQRTHPGIWEASKTRRSAAAG